MCVRNPKLIFPKATLIKPMVRVFFVPSTMTYLPARGVKMTVLMRTQTSTIPELVPLTFLARDITGKKEETREVDTPPDNTAQLITTIFIVC